MVDFKIIAPRVNPGLISRFVSQKILRKMVDISSSVVVKGSVIQTSYTIWWIKTAPPNIACWWMTSFCPRTWFGSASTTVPADPVRITGTAAIDSTRTAGRRSASIRPDRRCTSPTSACATSACTAAALARASTCAVGRRPPPAPSTSKSFSRASTTDDSLNIVHQVTASTHKKVNAQRLPEHGHLRSHRPVTFRWPKKIKGRRRTSLY